MRAQILLGLSQLGWRLFTAGPASIAVHAQTDFGLILCDLDESSSLPFQALKKKFGEIKSWHVIVFCPQGLDSSHLKDKTGNSLFQFWFWDTRSGNVFSSPPNKDRTVVSWLAQLAKGQIAPPPTAKRSDNFTPAVNYTLIALNILMFVLMTLSGGSDQILTTLTGGAIQTETLVTFGAKVNELIQGGQLWRFLASAFLHINILHLVFNLYALYSLGGLSERLLGHNRYLFLYLLSGVGGSVSSYLFSPAISAGASGAIFGLMGALLIYCWKFPRLWSTGLGTNLILVIIVNLVFGFSQPGIDNFAHLGGLVTGTLTCWLLLKFTYPDNGFSA